MLRFKSVLKQLAAALSLAAFLAPAAAQAGWLRGESAHFVVYANSGERTLREYLQNMEDYDRLLHRMHSGAALDEPASKLEIYLVNGARDLRRVFPEMNKDWAGVYTANPEGRFAVAFKPNGLMGYQVVKHEYYHHFMLQNFPGGYPGWVVEGLAEFFSSSERRGGKLVVGDSAPGRIAALAAEGWMPIPMLLSKGPFEVEPIYRQRYYAEAWLLTDYMMVDPDRRRRLHEYVLAVRGGADPLKAWTEKVGVPPDEMKSKLLSFRLTGFVADSAPPPPVPVTIAPMPDSADDMLLENQQLKHGTPDEMKADVLADVRADAARHKGDRMAELILARAEVELGDPAAAEALLKPRIEGDPSDIEARLLEAKALMKRGDAAGGAEHRTELYRDADRVLVPALKANPEDFRLLYLYARSRSVEPDYPSANMLRVLANAVALAPQVEELRFAAAAAAEQRGEIDTAIAILQPLASDPHAMKASRQAAERIEALNRRKAQNKG